MRARLLKVLTVTAIVLGGMILIPTAWGKLRDGPGDGGPPASAGRPNPPHAPKAAPPPQHPTLRAAPVAVAVRGFAAWALLERQSGRISGSANRRAVSSTESMIKVWIVSDYLRTRTKPSARDLRLAATAIVDSNDDSTEVLYQRGGSDRVIRRLIAVCGLQDTYVGDSGRWSRTQMSATDAVRMGACVADGRAAGPRWTGWVLDQMRKVRGTTKQYAPTQNWGGGRWGIIDGLPPAIVKQGVAIKNGWTQVGNDPVKTGPVRDNSWHVNCLAIHIEWVLAVLLRYPASYPLEYGSNACKNIARQLVTRDGDRGRDE